MALPRRKNVRSRWILSARQLLVSLALWIGIFACLRLGRFSQSQSLTLILLFTLYGVAEIATAKKNTPPPFEPLVVEIWPHMKPLLADYSLLDETKWSTVTASVEPDGDGYEQERKPWSSRFPVVFTVLSPSLCYSHNHNSFGTKLKDVIDIRSVCQDVAHHSFLRVPAFYFREKQDSDTDASESIEMLEFGLMITGERGLKELFLARLPKAIVDRAGQKVDLNATLRDLGWEREWIGGDDPDVDEKDVVEVLTHKYVTIRVQQI